jgi:hypothetical protein
LDEPEPVAMTRRQKLLDLLEHESRTFDGLAAELRTSTKVLETDLRSLERSLKAKGRRIVVEPAICIDCGFVFRGRDSKRFHDPSKCPRCRGTHLQPGRLSIK